jgi:hypothetical protein
MGCKSSTLNDGSACDDGKEQPCSADPSRRAAARSLSSLRQAVQRNNLCTISDHCRNTVCVGGGYRPAPPGLLRGLVRREHRHLPRFRQQRRDATTSTRAPKNTSYQRRASAVDNGAMRITATRVHQRHFHLLGHTARLHHGIGPRSASPDDRQLRAGSRFEWQIGAAMASQNGAQGADPRPITRRPTTGSPAW